VRTDQKTAAYLLFTCLLALSLLWEGSGLQLAFVAFTYKVKWATVVHVVETLSAHTALAGTAS